MQKRFAVLLVPALLVPAAVQLGAHTSVSAAGRCSVPSAGVIRAKDLPEHANAAACGAIGRVLELGKARMTVPPQGYVTTMNRLLPTGSDEMTIEVSAGGVVTYDYTDSTSDMESQAAAAAPGATPSGGTGDEAVSSPMVSSGASTTSVANTCTNKEYGLLNTKHTSAKSYFIGDGTVPAGGTFAQWQNAVAAAVKVWATEDSPCSSVDSSAVPALNYAGYTEIETNIGYNGCGTLDSYNVIDAGNLDSFGGVVPLAVTCSTAKAVTSGFRPLVTFDMKFNTHDENFTYNPTSCSTSYDLASVLTHEFGHVLGLADLKTASSYYQTMHFQIAPCKYYPRTLNGGDVTGLRVIY